MSITPNILIIQTLRMGDILMTLPLLLRLQKKYPTADIFFLAEEIFFTPLKEVLPSINFVSTHKQDKLKQMKWDIVINLSFRNNASEFAGTLQTDLIVGAVKNSLGEVRVHGNWALYRTSLVHNNRYNCFHWSDINCFDVLSLEDMYIKEPLIRKGTNRRIGLFLGASATDRYPKKEFWLSLAKKLESFGSEIVLLGGESEREVGDFLFSQLSRAENTCGKFNLLGLFNAFRTCACVISPDTGPMHLASLSGTQVYNLSLGSASPWDTGAYTCGQVTVRPHISCIKGCWQCTRNEYLCFEKVNPEAFAIFIQMHLLENKLIHLETCSVYTSARNNLGLYHLEESEKSVHDINHQTISFLWQDFFASFLELGKLTNYNSDALKSNPTLRRTLIKSTKAFRDDFWAHYKQKSLLDAAFFEKSSTLLKPLAGFAQMYIENADAKKESWLKMLNMVESFLEKIEE